MREKRMMHKVAKILAIMLLVTVIGVDAEAAGNMIPVEGLNTRADVEVKESKADTMRTKYEYRVDEGKHTFVIKPYRVINGRRKHGKKVWINLRIE